MLRVGVIGLGYWGPNLVRNLENIDGCHVVAICDRDEERLASASRRAPEAAQVSDADELMHSASCDAVVISTPTKTHYALAKQALEAGLHVFVEKPLATSVQQCAELVALAHSRQLTLFVGHVFLYSAPVRKLKQLVDAGDLGDICYIASSRLNLGPIRQDVNALWDLSPHDVSVILELIGGCPQQVSCSGLAYLNPDVHDVCTLTMHFEDRKMGIVHVSWLDPRKKREMTVVGSKKMVVYDDLEPLEKVKVYDIGVEAPEYADSFGEYQFTYRYGDTYSPRIKQSEPLKVECEAFVDSILQQRLPKTDGYNGLQVVSVLEAAEKSLQNGGGRVTVDLPGVHEVSSSGIATGR